jgi:hypothetical protein
LWHKCDRLLPVAELLAGRIRSAVPPKSDGAQRVLLIGSWGRGYFTHTVGHALRQGGGNFVIDTIHFDDEEDGCLRRNLELSGTPAPDQERVHLALLDAGMERRRTGSGVWWAQFADGTFDAVVVLPKTGQSYPVKPTTLTPEDHRAARMGVILAEAVRVVRPECGHLLIADEPYSALTTLADLGLVADHASDDAAVISDDPEVKIGHISPRFDSRCILIDVPNASALDVKMDTMIAGKSNAAVNTSEEQPLTMPEFDGDDARRRQATIYRFNFRFCLVLDYLVFALLAVAAFAAGAHTSVPTNIPPMLRIGATLGFVPFQYPAFSLFVRWLECDVRRYDVSCWTTLPSQSLIYLRAQARTFLLLLLFVVLFNGPFIGLFTAIGGADIGISLITLNAIGKSVFFTAIIVWVVATMKGRQRKTLTKKGISERTLVSFFD